MRNNERQKSSHHHNGGILTEATSLPSLTKSNKRNDKSKGTALMSNFLRLCFGIQVAYARSHSLHSSSTDKKPRAPRGWETDVRSSKQQQPSQCHLGSLMERQKPQKQHTGGTITLGLPKTKEGSICGLETTSAM